MTKTIEETRAEILATLNASIAECDAILEQPGTESIWVLITTDAISALVLDGDQYRLAGLSKAHQFFTRSQAIKVARLWNVQPEVAKADRKSFMEVRSFTLADAAASKKCEVTKLIEQLTAANV